jgi:hypothetical protein
MLLVRRGLRHLLQLRLVAATALMVSFVKLLMLGILHTCVTKKLTLWGLHVVLLLQIRDLPLKVFGMHRQGMH